MFNSTNNTPFTMTVMPATGGYGIWLENKNQI